MSTQQKKKPTPDRRKMNASESINNFLAWLSTRKQPIVLASSYDVAPVVQLLTAFRKYHGLPEIREGMEKRTGLVDLDHVNNVPVVNAVAATPASISEKILKELNHLDAKDQNIAVARVLQQLMRRRKYDVNQFEETRKTVSSDLNHALDLKLELENIANGNFALLF